MEVRVITRQPEAPLPTYDELDETDSPPNLTIEQWQDICPLSLRNLIYANQIKIYYKKSEKKYFICDENGKHLYNAVLNIEEISGTNRTFKIIDSILIQGNNNQVEIYIDCLFLKRCSTSMSAVIYVAEDTRSEKIIGNISTYNCFLPTYKITNDNEEVLFEIDQIPIYCGFGDNRMTVYKADTSSDVAYITSGEGGTGCVRLCMPHNDNKSQVNIEFLKQFSVFEKALLLCATLIIDSSFYSINEL